jgi:hypothetical protein
MRKLLIFFAAGCVGALVNSISIWLLGDQGITARLGIAIAPSLSPSWLYPRIVWGGLWGLLFILPLLPSRPLLKGLLISLAPFNYYYFSLRPIKGLVALSSVTSPPYSFYSSMGYGVSPPPRLFAMHASEESNTIL